MSDAGLEYIPFPAEEVRAMPDGSIAAMREPLLGHEAYIDVIPPVDAEDPRVQRRSVRRDGVLPPSNEPAPRTPEEQLLLELTEFNRNGCATDLRALHRMARTDHEPDGTRARAMALRTVEVGIRRGLLTSGIDVQWSPDWVAEGHPHRWHDEEGWHARCNDCLDESPAEPDEAFAYAWFADHRPVAHGDTAPTFRSSPPPIVVPLPDED